MDDKDECFYDYDDPIEEVYRIRVAIMEEFDWDVKKYNAYLIAKEPEFEAMGFKKAEPLAVREARRAGTYAVSGS